MPNAAILSKTGFTKTRVFRILCFGLLLSSSLLLFPSYAGAQTYSPGAFVTTWETTNVDETITIPTTGTGYNYNVDCDGDGTNDFTAQTGDTTCTYATSGMHTVVITGAFPRIFLDGGAGKNKIRSVAQWGNQVWTSMGKAFRGTTNFDITATDAPDLTRVTTMANMFDSAATFTGTNTDMSKWVVSNVQSLARTFYRARSFNGNIGNWNVGKVSTLFHAFEEASVFNQDISGWQLDALTRLDFAFRSAARFDQDLGNWDVSAVTNFNNMFTGTALSTANYERLLIGWAAQNLINARPFSVGTVQYCSFASAVARASIISDDEWMITDGGRCARPSMTLQTFDNVMRTVTVGVGFQAGAVTLIATSYSPTEADHGAVIGAANTQDQAALDQINFQPRVGFIVTEVKLLENAIIDIEVSNSAGVCGATSTCDVALSYTEDDLSTLGITATDLSIFRYTGSQWEELGGVVVDTQAMTISAVTSGFSPFALATVVTTLDDIAPSFAVTVPTQTYEQNTSITALTLPEAMDGNGDLTYTLTPLPDGLSFDAAMRILSGIPITAGTYSLTYTVVDADSNMDAGDSASLSFTITVESTGLTPSPDAFVTLWETTNVDETITIPTIGTGYNYNVDCDNDGSDEFTGATDNVTCTYPSIGIHTVVITGDFPRIYFNNGGDKGKILLVTQWGTGAWTSMEGAFRGANKLNILALDAPDLTNVNNMANMFSGASRFTGSNTPMETWDVSSVIKMASMFLNASVFNGNIGNWDVRKVDGFFRTFNNARVFNQDISGWQLDALTRLDFIFQGATLFDQNLGGWNVSGVTNFIDMFQGVSLSTANYESLLIGWAAQDLQDEKTLDVGTTQYCFSAAAGARASIRSDHGWSITDGGRCARPSMTLQTFDNVMRTVTVGVGFQAGAVTLIATSYSPTETDHGAVIGAANTQDQAALDQINFQPRVGFIVTEVKLLENAIIDIEVSNNAGVCGATSTCDVALSYTEDDLSTLGITATDLSIFRYTGSQWEELGGVVVDTQAMTISAVTSGFSPFALATVVTIPEGLIKRLNEVIMPRLTQAMLANTVRAVSNRVDSAFSGTPTPHSTSYQLQLDGVRLNSQSSLSSTLQGALQKLPTYVRSLEAGAMNWRQMLANSSFALSLDDNNNGGTNTGISLWGSSDYSQLSGKDNDLDWDGEVFSIQLGADKRIYDTLLVGGLMSWSQGDVDMDVVDEDIEYKGSYQHQMTSIHPYLAWSSGDIQLWGGLGYGQGELDIALEPININTPTRLLSLMAGAKGRLSHILSYKSDISLARTDIDKTDYSTEQHINSQRLRLLLEVQRQYTLASGRHFTPVLEVGMRFDGGDGDHGLGAVLDVGLDYANPATGLTLEGRLHTLADRSDYIEWGISGMIALTPAADGRGLAFSLSPSYGMRGSGTQAIWQQNQIDSLGVSRAQDYQARLDARLSYGFANGAGSLLQPYSEMTYGNNNSYRLGVQWQRDAWFDVKLFFDRREMVNDRAKHAVLLKGRMHF